MQIKAQEIFVGGFMLKFSGRALEIKLAVTNDYGGQRVVFNDAGDLLRVERIDVTAKKE